MSDKPSIESKIESLLGFDPTKQQELPVFDALKELKLERAAREKQNAKELLNQLIQLSEQQNKIDKEYKAAKEKFAKTAGKLLSKLNSEGETKENEE